MFWKASSTFRANTIGFFAVLLGGVGKQRFTFNALMSNIDYLAYNLESIKTGVQAPNMNSITERFLRSMRREALDHFLLTGRTQVQRILDEYIAFYFVDSAKRWKFFS